MGSSMLDGSYCGAGKICIKGQCVALDSSLGALTPVDGGWSPTYATDVENCGGGCSGYNFTIILIRSATGIPQLNHLM